MSIDNPNTDPVEDEDEGNEASYEDSWAADTEAEQGVSEETRALQERAAKDQAAESDEFAQGFHEEQAAA